MEKEKDYSIQNKLVSYVLANSISGDTDSAINSIDTFCNLKPEHRMMNIGPHKAAVVEEFLKKQPVSSFLELGTYVGYSAIRFSKLLTSNGRLLSIDVNPKTTAMATTISDHAKIKNIEFLLGGLSGQINFLKKEFPQGLDVIFLDHWKDLYVSDLNILEKNGLIRVGTRIVADNLLRPGAPGYIKYMTNNQHYQFLKVNSKVNYSSGIDQVGLSTCVQSF